MNKTYKKLLNKQFKLIVKLNKLSQKKKLLDFEQLSYDMTHSLREIKEVLEKNE